jgi:5'-nucleotidase
MRILVSNDDGIAAPGLAALEQAAARLGAEIWTVAPERKWTAASHQLSFDSDLTLTELAPRRHASSGSPADGVVAAMTVLFPDAGSRPDLVVSGVNDGRNAGEDVAYSGTLAIAREATFWGVPAIGFSRTRGGAWGEAEVAALSRLIAGFWRTRGEWALEGHYLSVNLPLVLPAAVAEARVGRDKIAGGGTIVAREENRITWRITRGRPHAAIPGDENTLIDSGHVAVTRLAWFAGTPLGEDLVRRWTIRSETLE